MSTGQSPIFGGLARQLVNDGLVSAERMQKAVASALEERTPLLRYVLNHSIAPANKVAWFISKEFGEAYLDLNALDLAQIPKDLVDEKIIHEFGVRPSIPSQTLKPNRT